MRFFLFSAGLLLCSLNGISQNHFLYLNTGDVIHGTASGLDFQKTKQTDTLIFVTNGGVEMSFKFSEIKILKVGELIVYPNEGENQRPPSKSESKVINYFPQNSFRTGGIDF